MQLPPDYEYLSRIVGQKASDLLRLQLNLDCDICSVPPFSVVPIDSLTEPLSIMPALPEDADTIPHPTQVRKEQADTFRRNARTSIAELAATLDLRQKVIRTSLSWPSRVVPRMPGIDSTVFCHDTLPAEEALTCCLLALWKPYTATAFRQAGLEPYDNRFSAGLIVMDKIDVQVNGTFYSSADANISDWRAVQGKYFRKSSDDESNFQTLRTISESLREKLGFQYLALDFLIDTKGRTFITQCESMEAFSHPRLEEPANFIEGPIVDLRRMERSSLNLNGSQVCLDITRESIVLVDLLHEETVDAFSLVWLATKGHLKTQPKAIILLHKGDGHVGLKSHLRWLLDRTFLDSIVTRSAAQCVPTDASLGRVTVKGLECALSLS